jgi:mannosyltransferase OCH1-like enzyme
MQTSIKKIDNYIVDTFRFFAPDYRYIHFVDSEIIDFFTENPSEEFPNLIEKFKSFTRGEHSTQLFRYYFLYLNGGIFIDSDAIFETNVNKIIQNYGFVSVKSFVKKPHIFDGFIATYPKNEIIYEILKHTYYSTDNSMLLNNYHYLCETLFDIYNKLKLPNTKIYQEHNKTHEGYGGSVILDDNNAKLISHYWKTKIIPNYNYHVLMNQTYTWVNSSITFLPNFEMNAFGKGNYNFVNNYNIIATFGGRTHNITFNENYTEFISIREDDSEIVKGILIDK